MPALRRVTISTHAGHTRVRFGTPAPYSRDALWDAVLPAKAAATDRVADPAGGPIDTALAVWKV